jgi:hypothetical protein
VFLTNKKKSIPIVIVVDKAPRIVLENGDGLKGATNLITDYKIGLAPLMETAS